MHNSNILFLINDHARAIAVQYEEGGARSTFKTLDQGLAVDDLVVVQSGTRWGMTVAKVVEVDLEINFDSNTPINWIVQRVDTDMFAEIEAREAEAINTVQSAERARKKKELREAMFAQHEDAMKSLQIADLSEETEVTE